VIAGAAAGLCGALAFALAHAIIIVPIWNRSGSGLFSGALAGAAAGWAYTELRFDLARLGVVGRIGDHLASGARFGALLWVAVVPVTVADALLRIFGLDPRTELVAVGVAVLLALAGGALLGWRRMRTRRAAIAAASATLLLTIAMVGPVPIARSPRALGIFFAVLPAAVVGGVILAALSWLLGHLGFFATAHRDAATPT
jgi:hypothetical protein